MGGANGEAGEDKSRHFGQSLILGCSRVVSRNHSRHEARGQAVAVICFDGDS
jgi:hypothetical protein